MILVVNFPALLWVRRVFKVNINVIASIKKLIFNVSKNQRRAQQLTEPRPVLSLISSPFRENQEKRKGICPFYSYNVHTCGKNLFLFQRPTEYECTAHIWHTQWHPFRLWYERSPSGHVWVCPAPWQPPGCWPLSHGLRFKVKMNDLLWNYIFFFVPESPNASF